MRSVIGRPLARRADEKVESQNNRVVPKGDKMSWAVARQVYRGIHGVLGDGLEARGI